jgi:hypothetical protein
MRMVCITNLPGLAERISRRHQESMPNHRPSRCDGHHQMVD